MSRRLYAVIALVLLAATAPAYPAKRTVEWHRFADAQSGTSVDIPANIFLDDGPAQYGSGRQFASKDARSRLAVYSLPNPDRDSPALYLSKHLTGFRYTKGEPRQFKRDDLERAVTREFCGGCGTQLITRRPGLNAIVLKAGPLDDPTRYGECEMAINASDRQAFNCIAEGLRIYEGLPPR